MTDLIVDFPSRRPASTKKVQFSKTSLLKFIKRIDEMADTNTIWYSSNDYKAMRVNNRRAVQQANMVLSTLSSSDKNLVDKVTNMDGAILTGIENMVSPDMIRRTISMKAQYMNSVLTEQESQESAGVFDADKLARVSRQHSKSSERRAYAIGKLHAR